MTYRFKVKTALLAVILVIITGSAAVGSIPHPNPPPNGAPTSDSKAIASGVEGGRGYLVLGMTSVGDIIELDKKPPQKVQLSSPAETLEDYPLTPTLSPNGGEGAKENDFLTAEDNENLHHLWQTVINRNPVIQYAIKQLATPPELRYAHSSIMLRTIGGLLSGASLLPYAMGSDQYTSGAATIGANLVDRALQQSSKIDPSQLPSDTELVQLSGVIQNLQKNLVSSYFQYKSSLTLLVYLQQQLDKLDLQREDASVSPDPLDDFLIEEMYQTTNIQLFTNREIAKQQFLTLERLAGIESMRNLQFKSMPISVDSGKIMEIPHSTSIEKETSPQSN